MSMVESNNSMDAFAICSKDEHILKKEGGKNDDSECCAYTLWSHIQP